MKHRPTVAFIWGVCSASLVSLAMAVSAGGVAAASPTITSLSVSGSPFAPDLAPLPQRTTISLTLSRKAKTTVVVMRLDGSLARRIVTDRRLAAGAREWTWAGKDLAGNLVADGEYLVRATTVRNGATETATRRIRKGLPSIFAANPGAIVIAVDPGHGGRFSGAVRDGLAEKDFNLDIGLKLRDLLEHAGVQVVMSRSTDVAVSEPPFDHNGDGKVDRYDDDLVRNDSANIARADVAVHVHNNASKLTSERGTGTYTSFDRTWTPAARDLGQLMAAEQFAGLDAYRSASFSPKNNGLRGGWYYYVGPYDPPYLPRPTLMPSVLSESLYLSNPSELDVLERADVRTSLAAAIYIALADYLNARDLGIGYEQLGGPSPTVVAGSNVTYRLRVTNRGNAPSNGWTLQLGSVAGVPIYDGSGQLGSLVGSVVVPNGLQPGASIDLDIAAVAPSVPGDWLIKSNVRLPGGDYASEAGVVSLQMRLATVLP